MIDSELFWSKVNTTAECWLWTGATYNNGYGEVGHGGKTLGAHRVSYELSYGAIPDGYYVCHTCDTPACVRPSHLFVGTPTDNAQDAIAKGRSSPPPSNTHLVGQNHPMSKLTEYDVQQIRTRFAAEHIFQKTLAAEYGVARSLISRIINRRLWK